LEIRLSELEDEPKDSKTLSEGKVADEDDDWSDADSATIHHEQGTGTTY